LRWVELMRRWMRSNSGEVIADGVGHREGLIFVVVQAVCPKHGFGAAEAAQLPLAGDEDVHEGTGLGSGWLVAADVFGG
jgi:hypothetical protein